MILVLFCVHFLLLLCEGEVTFAYVRICGCAYMSLLAHASTWHTLHSAHELNCSYLTDQPNWKKRELQPYSLDISARPEITQL